MNIGTWKMAELRVNIFSTSQYTQWSVGFTKLMINNEILADSQHYCLVKWGSWVQVLPYASSSFHFYFIIRILQFICNFFICRLVLFLAGIFNFVFHVDPWTCSVSNIKINLGGELEPATPWLQIRCSTNWANQADSPGQYADFWNGGGGRGGEFSVFWKQGCKCFLKMPIWGPKLGIWSEFGLKTAWFWSNSPEKKVLFFPLNPLRTGLLSHQLLHSSPFNSA